TEGYLDPGNWTGRFRTPSGNATLPASPPAPLWTQPPQTRGESWLVSSVHCVPSMLDKSDELRDRIEARKHELLAKYNDLKADSRKEAAESRTRLKARLDELESHLRLGGEKVSDDVRTKLNHRLERKDRGFSGCGPSGDP